MTGFNQEVDKFYSLIEQGKASSVVFFVLIFVRFLISSLVLKCQLNV